MLLPKDYFRDKIRPGTVLDGLLEDGLLHYIVDSDGLKLRLTPEGYDYFMREMQNKPRPKGKSLWRYIAMAVSFILKKR